MTITIGLIGARDYRGTVYKNEEYVYGCLDKFCEQYGITEFGLTTGGAKGVESIAVAWALKRGVTARKIPPNIQELGQRKAFMGRNQIIITQSDTMLFFWDGYVDLIGESISTCMHHRKTATVYPLV